MIHVNLKNAYKFLTDVPCLVGTTIMNIRKPIFDKFNHSYLTFDYF